MQRVDRICHVDPTVVVGVDRVEARGGPSEREEVNERVNRIGDVQSAITVCIAALERFSLERTPAELVGANVDTGATGPAVPVQVVAWGL